MTSIGWIKDEAEAFEMMAERHNTSEDKEKPQTGEDTKVVVSKGEGGGEGDGGFVAKSKKRGGGGGSNQRGKSGGDGSEDNTTTKDREAFDYSKVGSIGAYGPKGAPTTSNPFFSGAAISGGTLSGGSQPHKSRRRKRGKGGGGGGGGSGAGGGGGGGSSGERVGRRDAGNKTHVYRGGQR